MSELSREQVERIGAALHRWWNDESTPNSASEALAPTVAAMLDEARAEVVRDVAEWAGGRRDIDSLTRILARHTSAAAGAPLSASEASGGAGGHA